MTTPAERLPEEVLFMIFDGFDNEDALLAQDVCPAWYFAAHVMSLRDIALYKPEDIQRFIRSIDSNPHPAYLAAVKEIRIYNEDNPEYFLTSDELRKMFFRFPNLELVTLKDTLSFFKEMNDELCQEFLSSCPKLKTFKADEDNMIKPQVYEEIYNVRPLLTTLEINRHISKTRFKNSVMPYVTECSNLQSLIISSKALNNFGKFLTVFDHLPKLDTITMYGVENDQEHFAENFLATKSEEAQEQLVKRLSQFEKLAWRRNNGICLHSIRFIQKYLTGLGVFNMYGRFEEDWDNMEQRVFYQTLMEVVSSIRSCYMNLKMESDVLFEYYPFFLHKVLYSPAATSKRNKTRVLQLKITDNDVENNEVTHLGFDNRFFSREVTVSVSTTANLELITINLFSNDLPLDNIDMFVIAIDKRHNQMIKANTKIYCNMLKGMKSLKEVIVDVPATFKEISLAFNSATTEKYPRVKDVIINATSRAKFQTLLHQFSRIFPNIQDLTIRYFCGDWKQWMGEFQLTLPNYSLEELTIDVTPVKVNMKKLFNKQEFGTGDFFVIQLDLLSNSKQYLFKVFIKSMKPKRISNKDIEGLQRGKDYLRVNITVMNLERLSLRMNDSYGNKDELEDYFRHFFRGKGERIVLEEDAAMEIST